jgi:hypothetical protein
MTGRGTSNVGRREVDRRPAVTKTVAVNAATDAYNVAAAIERERAAMRNSWESVVANAAPLNGAHIGNFYNAKRKGH